MAQDASAIAGLQAAAKRKDRAPVNGVGDGTKGTFRAELRRRRVKSLLITGVEVAITVWLLWLSKEILEQDAAHGSWTFLGLTWGLWISATAFAWWNRRGSWRTAATTPRAFTAASLDRAHAKIRTAWLALLLLVLQGALLHWISRAAPTLRVSPWVEPGSLPTGASAISLGAAYVAWCLWYLRQGQHEAAFFREVLEVMDTDAAPTTPPSD